MSICGQFKSLSNNSTVRCVETPLERRIDLQICHVLSDSEWEDLANFCSKARRLIDTKIVSAEGNSIHGRIQYDADSGLKFEAELPSEELVAEFLMMFRFFYLNDEPSNFLRILSILSRHADEPEAREAIKATKARWKSALFDTALNLSLNQRPVTASILLDLWFNAHYFHSDAKKTQQLSELNKAFSESFSKFMLLDAAYNATKLILMIYSGLQELVESRATRTT